MKRFAVVVLGLLFVLLTAWTAWYKAPLIEAGLKVEISKALSKNPVAERVELTLNGRFAHLSGTVQQPEQIAGLIAETEDVYGGLRVTEDLTVLPIVEPYTMSMEKLSNGKVSITGYAANTIVRDAMIDHANKLFRRENVKANISVAGDMPDADWPGMAMRGMNGLDSLILGQATLTHRSLKITGTAENLTFIDQAREKVTTNIPEAYKDKGELDIAALPPIATPFLISFTKVAADGKLAVDGVTPDIEVAKAIRDKVGTAEKLTAFDLIEARGQPDAKWGQVAIAASMVPAKLVGGSVVLKDKELFIQGVADTMEDAKAIDKHVKQNLPDDYTLQQDLRILPRRVVGPSLEAEKFPNGNVNVDATFVDVAEKSNIELLFGPSVGSGDVQVVFEQVRTSVPNNWTSRLATSADILATLKQGKVSATPNSLVVEGETMMVKEDFDARFANVSNLDASVSGAQKPKPEVSQQETSEENFVVSVSATASISLTDAKPVVLQISDQEMEVVNGFNLPVISGEVGEGSCVLTAEKIVADSKIVFSTGAAEIDDESGVTLDKLASVLRVCTAALGEIVQIGGHTDSLGQDDDNMALSLARATSVQDALIARGVESAYLKAIGFGESEPIANDNTAEGRAKNRRIEFEIIKK